MTIHRQYIEKKYIRNRHIQDTDETLKRHRKDRQYIDNVKQDLDIT